MDIFVSNLPFQITEREISEAFAAHGEVSGVKMLFDKVSGRFRGMAFVSMARPADAEAAIAALNGADLGGRPMRVDRSRPREERFNGFGGGFDRGERIPARRRFRGSGKFSGGRRIAKRIQAAQRFRQRFPEGIRESFRQAVSLRRGRLQKTLRRRLWAAPQKVLGRARRRWRVLSANAAVAPRGLQSVRIFASGGVSVAYFSASGGVLPGLARRISQSATGFNRPRARFN